MSDLVAVLFRGSRFEAGKTSTKKKTCWNCRKAIQPGDPLFRPPRGTFNHARVLHVACAEAIAEDNECIRRPK